MGGNLDAKYLGELAALGAAMCWSISSIFFTIAGQRVGALVINRARLVIAVLLVGATHWLLYGRPFPVDAGATRYLWLTVSAILGLVIGDSLLFQAYILIGPRLGILLLSLSPLWGTLLAWIFLGERLTLAEMAAIAIAVGRRGLGGVGARPGKCYPRDARPRLHTRDSFRFGRRVLPGGRTGAVQTRSG